MVALWGSILEGVVAVPVDFRSSANMVERIAGIVSARALLIGETLHPPEDFKCPVWALRDVTDIRLTTASSGNFTPAAPDDVAEILFTSGATGDPKGVTITHRNILANLKPIDAGIEKYRKYMGPFAPIRFLNLLPLSHLFGQTMAAFIPPMIGGEVFFMSGYNPRDAARLIRKRRISVLVCVPQMLELLRDYIVQTVPPRPTLPPAAESGFEMVAVSPRPPAAGLEVLELRRRQRRRSIRRSRNFGPNSDT